MSEPKLTYGLSLQTQRLVSIASVPNGKECGLVCPGCEKPLIAKKGQKNQHHFAHYSGVDCPGARMSALHRLAQELLAEHKQVMLPEYDEGKYFHEDATLITFDEVRLEETIQVGDNQRRPDAIGIKDGVEYWIEIYVTHAVDDDKRKDIEVQGANCIEIDFSDLLKELYNEESVIRRLQQDPGFRKWVSSPILDAKAKEAKKEYDESIKRMIEEKRATIRQKIIDGFRKGDIFNITVNLPTICTHADKCLLSKFADGCDIEMRDTINLHHFFDSIEEITEYNGVPAHLVLTSSQHPNDVILIQIYDSEEQGHHKVGNIHRIIRLRFPMFSDVTCFDFRRGFDMELLDRCALHFFNFKKRRIDLKTRVYENPDDSLRPFFDKIILYKSGRFFVDTKDCIEILMQRKSSVAEYVINPTFNDIDKIYPATYLAKRYGLVIKGCDICKNERNHGSSHIICKRRGWVPKNEAYECLFFIQNKDDVDYVTSHFSDEDFIKIK